MDTTKTVLKIMARSQVYCVHGPFFCFERKRFLLFNGTHSHTLFVYLLGCLIDEFIVTALLTTDVNNSSDKSRVVSEAVSLAAFITYRGTQSRQNPAQSAGGRTPVPLVIQQHLYLRLAISQIGHVVVGSHSVLGPLRFSCRN